MGDERKPKEPRLRVEYRYGVRGWACFDKIATGWGYTQQSAYGRYQDRYDHEMRLIFGRYARG